jgi:hypothetical protein
LRQQVDAIREHFVMRASERGCMGAVVIDGVCCTSELPLVDWCDECLMGRMASLLESPAVLDHERSLVAEIQRLTDALMNYGRHKKLCPAYSAPTQHLDWCGKWDGFHENMFINETRSCTCPLQYPPACTCGLTDALTAQKKDQ